jgi:hypothetical protein
MSKVGSHDPFEHFKHKLWPKEGLGINWPLKVKNCFDFLTCKWHATYCWKDFNKGYNLSLDLISIEGLYTKLWAPKVVIVPILGISRFPFGSPGTKWHLGASPVDKHKVEGGRWWLPPSPSCGESCESVVARGSSVHQSASIMH